MRSAAYACVLLLVFGWAVFSRANAGVNLVEGTNNAPAAGKWQMASAIWAKSWTACKVNVATGDMIGVEGDKFSKYAEAGPIPAGDYEVQMLGGPEWVVVLRFDKNSGRTWRLQNGKMVEIAPNQ